MVALALAHFPPFSRSVAFRGAIVAVAVAGFMAVGTGKALASPVACGATITHDTTLQNDLANCTGDGLVIGADNIMLNLNGHTVDGVQTGPPVCGPPFVPTNGIRNDADHVGVTVENGTIQQFGEGVSGGFSHSILRDLTLRDNPFAGVVIGASHPLSDDLFAGNVVSANGCDGVRLTGVEGTRIVNNRANGTTAGAGIDLIADDDALVTRNSLSDNNGQGIVVSSSSNSTITRNSVSGGGALTPFQQESQGIILIDSSRSLVARNSVSHNNDDGIVSVHGDQHRFINNEVTDNAFGGLLAVAGSTDVTFARNSSLRNNFGVIVDENSLRTLISKNTVDDSRIDGMFIGEGSVGTVIEKNIVERNGFSAAGIPGPDGIHVNEPATTLTKNTANDNDDYGIEAVSGVIDGGGNKARGNGNPAQCLNVVCK